ncbi:MAG: hypothetical protein ACP5HU_02935 [Phycisphaerae bacterium]
MNRPLLNRPDTTSDDGGALSPRRAGTSALANARRRLPKLGVPVSRPRTYVRCRRVHRDGVVMAALRRYHENEGAYIPAEPAATVTFQA